MSSAVIVSRMSWRVWRSDWPGKRGRPLNISAKMQPIAHTSTEVLYEASPTSSSGARYHLVDT